MLLKNKKFLFRHLIVFFSIKSYAVAAVLLCTCYTLHAQINGCPDPAANNYNSAATVNDGSCTYNSVSIQPKLNTNLSTKLNETSGLIWWNNQVWTHNDSGGDPVLYAVDTATGKILRKVTIKNATNVDWEDITQDDTYIYIGDIGNNANGNRQDLKIYKVKKADVMTKSAVKPSIINYSYSDQTNFDPTGNNKTNFDCEALIAYGDSLYLFSKDWVDNKTRLYKLPKKAGIFTAVKIGELDVQGLITGAEVIADKRVIVLTGYNSIVTPFIYLLYDFTGSHFFAANKRKVGINQSFLQMEGICATSDTGFYVSNEKLTTIFTTKAKLQTLNLAALLNPYYNKQSTPTVPITKHTTHYSKMNSVQVGK